MTQHGILIGSPFPAIVTTRIITFLVGNPYKPSFPLLLGRGTTQDINHHHLAILCDLLKWLSDLQLGDEKVTKNHLASPFFRPKIQAGTTFLAQKSRNRARPGRWPCQQVFTSLHGGEPRGGGGYAGGKGVRVWLASKQV